MRLGYDSEPFEVTKFLVRNRDTQTSGAVPIAATGTGKDFDGDNFFAAVDYLISLKKGFIMMETRQLQAPEPRSALNLILAKENNSVTCTDVFHKFIVAWRNDFDCDIRW